MRRYYDYRSTTLYMWCVASADSSDEYNTSNYLYRYSGSDFQTMSVDAALRPIVTLKSGLSYSGSGTQADPWVIE